MNNTFEFIKRSRPKIKVGDWFYYKLNNQYYIGLVLRVEDNEYNLPTCLFLRNAYQDVSDIEEEYIKANILDKELLMPPIRTNKKGWTNGFFVMNGNIDLSFAKEVLEKVSYTDEGYYMYNSNYIEQENHSCPPDFLLCGDNGLYATEGVESLLQIALDLEFSMPNEDWYDPYKYYEILEENCSKNGDKRELPFWYYKAKERLNK